MKILILILVVFLLFIFDLKIRFKINKLEIYGYSKNIKFDINFEIYIFRIIKILIINLNQNGINCLFFKIKYKKIRIKNNINFDLIKKFLKEINLKFKRIEFEIKIGIENLELTVLVVFFISMFFAVFFEKNKDRININQSHYTILPSYNNDLFYINGTFVISIKIYNLIKGILLIRKNKKFEINKKISPKEQLKYC